MDDKINVNIFSAFSILLLTTALTVGDPHVESTDDGRANHYNYDVKGMDFLNTQTEKLCLLARLNVSIVLTYKESDLEKHIFIPASASNEKSVCDFNFVSTLQLDFAGLSFKLDFKRDSVETLTTQRGYCDNCDVGHWALHHIAISTDDIQKAVPEYPRTQLVAEADGSQISTVSGGLRYGVKLERGYRCTDEILIAKLNITEAVDITEYAHSMSKWKAEVRFYYIEVQPFLVTNKIVKEPLLCKDVTVFIALIITMPIIYFIIFVTLIRVRERYGFPNWGKKMKGRIKAKKYKRKKKEAAKSKSEGKVLLHSSSSVKSTTVSVTCKAPDAKDMQLI